ncbi:hypothetical protein B0H19DRAFT_1270497 [Mycena capillaripes]|nr:hypothetical protein B0H19DRAFT_1270497 [Mycena capillaripes]
MLSEIQSLQAVVRIVSLRLAATSKTITPLMIHLHILPVSTEHQQFLYRVETLDIKLVITHLDALLRSPTPQFPHPPNSDCVYAEDNGSAPDPVVPEILWSQLTDCMCQLTLTSPPCVARYYRNALKWKTVTRQKRGGGAAQRAIKHSKDWEDNQIVSLIHPSAPSLLCRVLQYSPTENSMASSFPFFNSFVFPNLTHLNLDVVEWPEHAFFALQERFRFTITHLLLCDLFLDREAMTKSFQGCLAIESLALIDLPAQTILEALTYRVEDPFVLPRLTSKGGSHHDDPFRWNVSLRPDDALCFARLEDVAIVIQCPLLSPTVEDNVRFLVDIGLVNDRAPRTAQTNSSTALRMHYISTAPRW